MTPRLSIFLEPDEEIDVAAENREIASREEVRRLIFPFGLSGFCGPVFTHCSLHKK